MSQQLWNDVDAYLNGALHEPDSVLEAANESAAAAGLPPIAVSAAQGKLLHILARMCGARRILEVGTLGGYSTIWLARALPEGGSLLSLEIDPKHAEVARANLERAGLEGLVEVRVGAAIETMAALAAEGPGPEAYDFAFIDADKQSNADYFEWALAHSHPGSVIVVDNTVRGGAVADPERTDDAVLGVRRLHDLIHSEPGVTATGIQTVGTKGYDGFTIGLVL